MKGNRGEGRFINPRTMPRPFLPPEQKRVTISVRIDPEVRDYLKKHRLLPGRILDAAVRRLMGKSSTGKGDR